MSLVNKGGITDQLWIIQNSGKKIGIKEIENGNIAIILVSSKGYAIEHIWNDNVIVSREEFPKDYYPEGETPKGVKVFKTYPLHAVKRIEWGELDPTNFEPTT